MGAIVHISDHDVMRYGVAFAAFQCVLIVARVASLIDWPIYWVVAPIWIVFAFALSMVMATVALYVAARALRGDLWS